MHYHWNRNLFYHEMLLAIQVAPRNENQFYSDLSNKPIDHHVTSASTKAQPDLQIATNDKAPKHSR